MCSLKCCSVCPPPSYPWGATTSPGAHITPSHPAHAILINSYVSTLFYEIPSNKSLSSSYMRRYSTLFYSILLHSTSLYYPLLYSTSLCSTALYLRAHMETVSDRESSTPGDLPCPALPYPVHWQITLDYIPTAPRSLMSPSLCNYLSPMDERLHPLSHFKCFCANYLDELTQRCQRTLQCSVCWWTPTPSPKTHSWVLRMEIRGKGRASALQRETTAWRCWRETWRGPSGSMTLPRTLDSSGNRQIPLHGLIVRD